ncbi:MAG: DUF3696 domain-containing protein [Gammaproteobacteria bacterium]|nr:DUF3696 domain-containing protein [Gammaproteobacteria bacterium]
MISSLHVSNFKCFRNQTVEFGKVTLLSGLNGMGKSSVFQALLLLRQSCLQGLLQKTGLVLNGELAQIGMAEDALFENAKDPEIGFELSLNNGVTANWRFQYVRGKDTLKHAATPPGEEVFSCSLFKNEFHYLEAERTGPRIAYPISVSRVQEQRQFGNRGEFITHFLQLFGTEKISCSALAFPGLESRQLVHQVEAWLGKVSPGIRLNFVPHTEMDLINLQYSFARKGEVPSGEYRTTNVGFGITYALPVIVALLSSEPGSLVLLDSPDAHLHPQGQVQMGRLIALAANCGIQAVVETHSDHILNGIRLAVHAGDIEPEQVRLHFFQRAEQNKDGSSEIVSLHIDRDGRIDEWPEGFFDEWENSLDALMEPSGHGG